MNSISNIGVINCVDIWEYSLVVGGSKLSIFEEKTAKSQKILSENCEIVSVCISPRGLLWAANNKLLTIDIYSKDGTLQHSIKNRENGKIVLLKRTSRGILCVFLDGTIVLYNDSYQPLLINKLNFQIGYAAANYPHIAILHRYSHTITILDETRLSERYKIQISSPILSIDFWKEKLVVLCSTNKVEVYNIGISNASIWKRGGYMGGSLVKSAGDILIIGAASPVLVPNFNDFAINSWRSSSNQTFPGTTWKDALVWKSELVLVAHSAIYFFPFTDQQARDKLARISIEQQKIIENKEEIAPVIQNNPVRETALFPEVEESIISITKFVSVLRDVEKKGKDLFDENKKLKDQVWKISLENSELLTYLKVIEENSVNLKSENEKLKLENGKLKAENSMLLGNNLEMLDLHTLEEFEHKQRETLTRTSLRIKQLKLEQSKCVVCLEKAKEVALVPCGHKALCSACAEAVTLCPLCRTPKQFAVKIFEP